VSTPSADETRAAVATLKETLVLWVDELHRLDNQRKQIQRALDNARLASNTEGPGEAPEEWARRLKADAAAELSLHKNFLADREQNTKRGEAIASAARVVWRFAHTNGIDAAALILVVEHHQFARLDDALFVLNAVEYLLPNVLPEAPESFVAAEPTVSNLPEVTADPTERLVDEENKVGTIWQKIAERLNELRRQGERCPGQHKLADRLGCSPGTINKAIHSSAELTEWARRTPKKPKAQQSLNNDNAAVADDAVQVREPDPTEAAAEAELLRELIEKASPAGRAFINEIRNASRQFLTWFLEQTKEKREWCQEYWRQTTESDPNVSRWFLSLSATDQIEYFTDAGDPPTAFPEA
jgi:hypothetical protein